MRSKIRAIRTSLEPSVRSLFPLTGSTKIASPGQGANAQVVEFRRGESSNQTFSSVV